jgi:6-phospho-3-hexuloisomerase
MQIDKDAFRKSVTESINLIHETLKTICWTDFIYLAEMISKVKRIFVVGAGRSGLVARSFGMRLMHAGLQSFIPGETITPAIYKGDLLVAISCTGETGYTNYLVKRAKELGGKIISFTAEANSSLAKLANKAFVIPAKGENIVLKAATFEHTTSICLDAVFNVIKDQLKIDIETYKKTHANLE